MQQQQQFGAPQPQYAQPVPQVITIAQTGGGCPQCKTGNMVLRNACTFWTVLVCWYCVCGLCCDCAWGKKSTCMSCGYTVQV